MPQRLILIRGNSSSGKSTIAKKVRSQLGHKVMFLQQDVLRRDILNVSDKKGNPVVGLINHLVRYGHNHGYDVILEGILTNEKYGVMLKQLLPLFELTHVYYLDITFEETLQRHAQRPQRHDFGETELRKWWREKDYLDVTGEQIIDEQLSADEIAAKIVKDILEKDAFHELSNS